MIRCACGRVYTYAQARERQIGTQSYGGSVVMLWNCRCGSTRAVELVPHPEDVRARLGEEAA